MTDASTAIDTYFRMWNETDPVARVELVRRAWTGDGRHVDPLADVQGHSAIDEMVAGVQSQFPDATIRRTSAVDGHHDHVRYAWQLVTPDGTVVVSAIDVALLADDGRLHHVAAFFGDLKEDLAA